VTEPNFFNLDNKLGVATLEAYEQLFRNASHRHAIRGEASVWQLTSPAAVRNLLRHHFDARFTVMLRNPVELAPALHMEMSVAGHESVRACREARDLQDLSHEGRDCRC
jgi:hypothetical protein